MRVAPVVRFGGLDIASTPDESACIDMLNVDLDVRGAVRSRDGYEALTGTELTNQPDSLFPHYESDGTKQLIVGNGNRLDALNTSGTSVANVDPGAGTGPHFFARFGGPAAEVTYIANGTDQVHAYNGTAFSAPAGLSGQTGKFLAVTPISNRLMVARESGTTLGNNPSSVNFSVDGSPEDFTVANGAGSEDLDPGDGEALMGMVGWRNYVFLFKETKFWVYYGEGVTSSGAADFLFRKVNAGVGLVASKAVCAGREGVYFLDRTGVYVTQGGDPEPVSGPITPLFFGAGPSDFYQGDIVDQTIVSSAMAFYNERLHVALPVGTNQDTNNHIFVYDPRTRDWLDWDIPAAAMTTFRAGAATELLFAAPTDDNHVYRHSTAYPNDDGTAITSRYRTGFTDLGAPGQAKTVQQSRLWGQGTVNVQSSKDFGALDTATSVALGTAPAIAAGKGPGKSKFETASYQFGASVPWRLDRFSLDVIGHSPPGAR